MNVSEEADREFMRLLEHECPERFARLQKNMRRDNPNAGMTEGQALTNFMLGLPTEGFRFAIVQPQSLESVLAEAPEQPKSPESPEVLAFKKCFADGHSYTDFLMRQPCRMPRSCDPNQNAPTDSKEFTEPVRIDFKEHISVRPKERPYIRDAQVSVRPALGRPKKWASEAERLAAYRERKKVGSAAA